MQYLRPLTDTTHLPNEETQKLLTTTQNILRFQETFYESLREASGADLRQSPEDSFESNVHLRVS